MVIIALILLAVGALLLDGYSLGSGGMLDPFSRYAWQPLAVGVLCGLLLSSVVCFILRARLAGRALLVVEAPCYLALNAAWLLRDGMGRLFGLGESLLLGGAGLLALGVVLRALALRRAFKPELVARDLRGPGQVGE